MYCIEHHSTNCVCQLDITDRIDSAKTVLSVADYNIRILRRDKFELVEIIKELITECPVDNDWTPEWLEINKRAAALIEKHSK